MDIFWCIETPSPTVYELNGIKRPQKNLLVRIAGLKSTLFTDQILVVNS